MGGAVQHYLPRLTKIGRQIRPGEARHEHLLAITANCNALKGLPWKLSPT